MSIDGLVVEEAWRHLREFHNIKGMDPMAQHILKTSNGMLPTAMREWMRAEALRQHLEAMRWQEKANDHVKNDPYAPKSGIRKVATIHPRFVTQAVQQGHAWGDKDFVGYLKRENPKVFPKRDSI